MIEVTNSKLNHYISAAKKQQEYVSTFQPVYCTDTVFTYYGDEYIDSGDMYSTFDLRKDPLYSDKLTIEELSALISEEYFSYEELKLCLDQLIYQYCLNKEDENE